MEYDEDATEWSIHDLDHAPEPPTQHGLGFRLHGAVGVDGGDSESVSPPQRYRSHSATGPYGGGDSWSETMSPRNAFNRIRKGSLDLRFAVRADSWTGGSNHSRSDSSALPLPPTRRRSKSQTSIPSPGSPTPTDLSHVQSFPPGMDSSCNDRKGAFAQSREGTMQQAMLNIPEEEKEEEALREFEEEYPYKEIVLSGSEIDEVDRQNENKINRSDSTSRWSDTDFISDVEDDDTVEGDEFSATTLSAADPVVILGLELPVWFSKRRISWDRVSMFVVEKAPCFLCSRMKHSTYRSILLRLNMLCAFFAIAQMVFSIWFYMVIQSPYLVDRELPTQTQEEIDFQSNFEVLTNVWNLNGSIWFLGLLALLLFMAIICTVRVIQNVNLAGAIRFLWIILWVLPLQVFWTVGLFDYFQVTAVWVKFWWRDLSMAWFRKQFCFPSDTANKECSVPVYQSVADEMAWCIRNFDGATNCAEIRDNAQNEMISVIYVFYYCNAAWALCNIVLLFLVVKTLESIISKPLVQKSRNNNLPSWLLLPITGCLVCGVLYSFSSTSVLNTRSNARSEASWIGPLFITAGGLFFVAALLAWYLGSFSILNTRGKRRKYIGILAFITISFCLLILLTTIFSASIAFTVSLEEIPISGALRGDIACFIDQSGSCTNCDKQNDRCLEWSSGEVTRILQTQVKAGAALAGIFLIYAAGCLRYGFTLWRHILNYEIEYV